MGATAFQRRRRELAAQVSVVEDMTVMDPPTKEEKPEPKKTARKAPKKEA